MRINYISDLHLEFGMPPKDLDISGDILVVAGDLTVKADDQHLAWLNSLDFKHVLYILGNHEFYRSNLEKIKVETLKKLSPHVHLLDDSSITLEGITFHGSTLWTSFNNGDWFAMNAADQGMNDFRLIRFEHGERKFNSGSAKYLHEKSVQYLLNEVQPGDVIITHHAPSYGSIHEMYAGQILNHAYASDLEWLIDATEPKYWIHGHMHASFDYFRAGCNILCNPRGYAGYEENLYFDWNKSVEI